MARIKYFHSLGLPWYLDSSRNTQLLSEIACYENFDDVKWAYENGYNGGHFVSYVKEEWEEDGILKLAQWKANKVFFEENKMLSQEFKDAELGLEYAYFLIFCTSLKSLLDHGYTFRSQSEKDSVTKEAYLKCCEKASIYSDNWSSVSTLQSSYSKIEKKFKKKRILF